MAKAKARAQAGPGASIQGEVIVPLVRKGSRAGGRSTGSTKGTPTVTGYRGRRP